MKHLLLLAIAVVLTLSSLAQINLSDSTVSVYGYWNLHNKQTYQAAIDKYTLNLSDTSHIDTTAREEMRYKVDIEIIDSTANSYTINWRYYDFESNALVDNISKLMAVTKNMTVIYKTSELGQFTEVVNWKEIKNLIANGTDMLREQLDDDALEKVINDYKQIFGSKESIEAGAIHDIQLFHYFHGGRYKIGQEYNIPQKFVNMFGGDPFDGMTNVWIDTIDTANYFSTFRSYTAIDELQLTNATFNYITDLSKRMKVTAPSVSDMPNIKNETYVYTQVHDSGWILYTSRRKETIYAKELKVEELSLELL